MLQVHQTDIIAGSGESWNQLNLSFLSFTNFFPLEHECLLKVTKGPFIEDIALHLRARDEPPNVTEKIFNQIKQWTETRAIGHFHRVNSDEHLTAVFMSNWLGYFSSPFNEFKVPQSERKSSIRR